MKEASLKEESVTTRIAGGLRKAPKRGYWAKATFLDRPETLKPGEEPSLLPQLSLADFRHLLLTQKACRETLASSHPYAEKSGSQHLSELEPTGAPQEKPGTSLAGTAEPFRVSPA